MANHPIETDLNMNTHIITEQPMCIKKPLLKKENIFFILLLPVIFLTKACHSSPDVASIVRKANVVYDSAFFQTGHPHIPLYVANGIIGGCFDHMGFQSRPNTGMPEGRTVIGYIRHYDKTVQGRHVQFPLCYITASWDDGSSVYNLVDAREYKQELDLYSGTLTTSYHLHGKTVITAFASQQHPNLFCMHIRRKSTMPCRRLILRIECETSGCQNNDSPFKVNPVKVFIEPEKDLTRIRSVTSLAVTDWVVYCPDVSFEVHGTQLWLTLKDGDNDLRILVNHPQGSSEKILNEPYDSLLAAHQNRWKNEWECCWINFPEDRAHKIWTRMNYYTLCNFPLISEKPMIPSGLNSNIWGFTFPQDVYYVEENLPRTGHFLRAGKALQYWLDILPEVRRYSKRVMGVEGAYYPWTPPFCCWDDYEKNGVVSKDSYELHNPAYVAAMIWHYYLYTFDTAWLKKYYPVIRDVFEFYKNISSKNKEGTYDIYHVNARGQDEASGTEGRLKNLLCAGYSAEYMAHLILHAAPITGDTTWLSIAGDMAASGMNRKNLMRADGIYTTYEGDNRPANSQKHPVQLNPITYLPMPFMVKNNSSPVVRAWENRYQLTIQAHKPFTAGWTLGQFFLASCRMQSPAEAKKDLDAIQPCHGADPLWIQFYESSFWERWHVSKAYYFPMMGLYQQALTDALVQDWRGYTELFACLLPGWENKQIAFHGIRTIGGAILSGTWDKGKFTITIEPGKAKSIELRIAQPCEKIRAKGFKEGKKIFKGNEIVSFVFDGNNKIKIKGKVPQKR